MPKPLSPLGLGKLACRLALEKKALDPLLLDMRPLTTITDFFLILAAESEPQIKAIANHIEKELKKAQAISPSIDGFPKSQWMIMDYGSLIIHIFHKDKRAYYSLETLWGDAKRITP
jgi:ribosome-associated protein